LGTRARREREKQDMKSAILDAATKIIIEEGYDKLSMRKIAEAIEYTPTTLYSYYKDKSEIIAGISKEMYLKIVNAVTNTLQDNKSLPINYQLKLSFIAFINTMTSNAEMGKAVMNSGTDKLFGSNDESESDSDSGVLMLYALLQEGQRQSVLRKLDENVAWMLITALLGFSMNAIESKLYLNGNWNDLVETYVEILINGIQPIK